VRTAFFASDKLVLETLVPKAARSLAPAAVKRHTAGGDRLRLAGSSASNPTLADVQGFDQARHGRRPNRGLSSENGADAVLRDTADMYGKPVAALETFQSQMDMFNSLPRSNQPIPSAQDPEAMKALGQLMLSLQLAWSQGDVDTFGSRC
jgi:uncharacterized protein